MQRKVKLTDLLVSVECPSQIWNLYFVEVHIKTLEFTEFDYVSLSKSVRKVSKLNYIIKLEILHKKRFYGFKSL